MKTKFSLWSHHHYGWEHHQGYYETERDAVLAVLFETHEFLDEFRSQIRIEVVAGQGASFEKKVGVYWADEQPKYGLLGMHLYKGDFWLSLPVNFAPPFACRLCGGTGMDHYVGPFFYCWACDGERLQKWESGGEKIRIPSYKDVNGAEWCIMKPRPWIRGGDNEYAGCGHEDAGVLRNVG